MQLALASVRLRQGATADALALFEALAATQDARPVWLGLAAARLAASDPSGAAAALAATLAAQKATVDLDFAALANRIAEASGAAGWCAVGRDGRLHVAPSVPGRLRIALDERPVRARAPPAEGLPLPSGWEQAGRLTVVLAGRALLGSPISVARFRRAEGFVACRGGGIEGWAWLPAAPETDPVLAVLPGGRVPGFAITATGPGMDAETGQLLARPRRFSIAPERLADWRGAVRITGPDQRDLLGSPLHPDAERASAAALARALARRSRARGAPRGSTAVAALAAVPADIVGVRLKISRPTASLPRAAQLPSVVIPVYGKPDLTLQCLEQVRATVPRGIRVIVVDDASPDPELAAVLDRFASEGVIRLLRQSRNRGFPASANAGLRAAGRTDAILLNSDALVAPHWVERLCEAAYAARDIGTVTPLSNAATILSYPHLVAPNPVPDQAGTVRLAALAEAANGGSVVDIPTAIGFCMYLRRDCLDEVGLFREDVFAQGYGEENDFCLRARHLGWRHVAAPGVFVAHVGGQSFGSARADLLSRNLAILNRLHPGYDALIADYIARDPLAEARRRLDIARWRAGAPKHKDAVLLVTHDRGGGVQRRIAGRAAQLRAEGLRPIVLTPVHREAEPEYAGLCEIGEGQSGKGAGETYPNLRYALPDELDVLASFLAENRVVRAEIHHLLGHDHTVVDLCAALGVPYEVHIHDYAWFCPRISLLAADRRYCGEPDIRTCETCVRDSDRAIEEDISVPALRARSAEDFARAQRVIAPSADAGSRIARHFPGITPEIVPWETDPPAILLRAAPPPAGAARRICVIGAIGYEKGYDVLLAAARDAARRNLPIDFVVVGYTTDDDRLMETGRVFITGEYGEAEATALIAAQRAHLAWLPSIWPETWCYALSEAWRAGLHVIAFDIGAQAERIRNTGRGTLLPLGLTATSINNALMTARPVERRDPAGKRRFTLCGAPSITQVEQPAPFGTPTDPLGSEIVTCQNPAAPL